MIYLDNSATTAPNEAVLASFIEVNNRYYGNPSSLHRVGKEAEMLLESARNQICSIVGAQDGEVIFTSGGTEANNLAIIGLARAYRKRGNHIITTSIEHPSILNAAKQLENEGFEVDYLTVDENGLISTDELKAKLREHTTVVSIMHVNNEIGTIQPVEACAKIIKEHSRAIFHSDIIQSIGKLPVALKKDGPDVISISAHKIHGLKASGVLVMRKGIHLEAINYGGGQEKGLRSGTVSVPNAVTIAKAIRISAAEDKSIQYRKWRNQIIESIIDFKEIRILAKETAAPHILSIAFLGIKGEVAVNYFQEHGIFISTSSACSSKSGRAGHVIEAIRVAENYKHGVIRISFGENNNNEDIDFFLKHFKKFIKLLGRGKSL